MPRERDRDDEKDKGRRGGGRSGGGGSDSGSGRESKSIGNFGESPSDKAKRDKEMGDAIRDAFAKSGSALGGGREPGSGNNDNAIPVAQNPASDVPYGASETGMSQLVESMPPEVEAARARARAAQQSAEDEYKSSKIPGAAGTLLGGPIIGAGANVIGGYVGRKAAGMKAYDDKMAEAGFSELRGSPGERAERDGGKDLMGQPTTPAAPVQPEVESPAPPQPEITDPNAFTGKARRKKGYLSTILGGGISAGTPQGKTLLGA